MDRCLSREWPTSGLSTDPSSWNSTGSILDAVATGSRWLERPDIARAVVDVLLKGEREFRYELGAWVLMPHHLPVSICPLDRDLGSIDRDLGSTVRGIKGGSAREVNLLLKRNGTRFWAKDYFERRIRDSDHEGRVARYIENNPVKAGLCGSAEDWLWSSARKNATEVACTGL